MWKLTTNKRITLHRLPASKEQEQKYSLVYFLNPSLFNLKLTHKKVPVNSQHNIMFFPNNVTTEFTVVPKHPFYVLDISFSASWLSQQHKSETSCFDHTMNLYINDARTILAESCNAEEYRTLHALEASMMSVEKDILFIRSRIYKMICSFLNKQADATIIRHGQKMVHYDQVVSVENIIQKNLRVLPNIKAIARNVNMSVSTLLRQFKSMYGKSIHEYYMEKKMDWAKKMLVEEKMNVKDMATMLGYKQASPFIEAFKKVHGVSPGSLKNFG
jgi:AraC-like DNA-binding protein